MKRHAAHRRALRLAAVLACQHKVKLARGCFGIVIEHLIEIAYAIHEDIFSVFVLYIKILLHHRCRHCFSSEKR